MRFCARLEKAVNSLWKVKMASCLLILTQSDKRTKFDKEVELAEDGKYHLATSFLKNNLRLHQVHNRIVELNPFEPATDKVEILS